MDQLIGKRTPDAVLISIGANDIGFGEIVKFCGLPTRLLHSRSKPCGDFKDPKLQNINLITGQPIGAQQENLTAAMTDRLKALPAEYREARRGSGRPNGAA